VTAILSLLAFVQAAGAAPAQPAAASPPAPPTAAGPSQQGRFEACLSQVQLAAERAVETANAWRAEGGGFEARQCLALAYVELGRWRAAATVYEQAAREAEAAQDPRRAGFWAQAGNAWLAADEGTQAMRAFDAALASPNLAGPLRGEIHLDRARALVALSNPAGARTELDAALALVPQDPMAWYLSAGLAARRNDLARAATDIARARQLAGSDPDVLLLAGTIAGLQGNGAEAERLYRQVAEAAPQTDAGRSAAAALATMRDSTPPAAAPAPQPQSTPAAPPR
jgi:tetratricopeptide (TPR) repeat protein